MLCKSHFYWLFPEKYFKRSESTFFVCGLSFQVYAAWETDEIIGFELWRNLGLALVCVFVITLILLANIQICLMVLLCVTLTLVSFIYCQGYYCDDIPLC